MSCDIDKPCWRPPPSSLTLIIIVVVIVVIVGVVVVVVKPVISKNILYHLSSENDYEIRLDGELVMGFSTHRQCFYKEIL